MKSIFKLADLVFEKYTKSCGEIRKHNEQIQKANAEHQRKHMENQQKIDSINNAFNVIRYK
jgi:hypothetical protein